MSVAVSLLFLIAIASAVAGWIKRPFELVLPVVVSGLMILFWLAGYIVPIDWLHYALWVIGLLALISVLRLNRARIQTISASGIIAFILITAILAFVGRNTILLSWDEFSHWGQVARFLAETGRYPSTGEILFDGYPFGTAVLQVVIGGSNETAWVFVQNFLKVAALMPLAAYLPLKRHVPSLLFLGAFAVGTQVFFSQMGGPVDILIDMPLALYAGAALVIYFREENTLVGIALATIIAASLPLFKDMGVVLAAFVTGAIFLDQLAVRFKSAGPTYPVFLSVGPFVSALMVDKIRVSLLGPVEGFGFSLNWSVIKAGVNNPGFGGRFTTTVENFFTALASLPITKPGMALPFVLLLLAGIIVGCAIAQGRQWFRPVMFFAISIAGLAAYLLLILVTYIFSFTEYEGTRLASYPRYLNTFLVMLLVASLGFLPARKVSIFQRIACLVPLALALFFMRPWIMQMPAEFDQSVNASLKVRQESLEALANMPVIQAGEQVYVLWNGTIGEEFYMTKYSLVPHKTNRGCFSVGAARGVNDVWSCDLTTDEFVYQLRSYSYVLVGRADEEFRSRFGALFMGEPRTGWYKIQVTPAGVKLSAVPTG